MDEIGLSTSSVYKKISSVGNQNDTKHAAKKIVEKKMFPSDNSKRRKRRQNSWYELLSKSIIIAISARTAANRITDLMAKID